MTTKLLLFALLALTLPSGLAFSCNRERVRMMSSLLGAPTDPSTAELGYRGIQHVGLLVKSTEVSVAWYLDTLGFKDETNLRPNLPYPGAFLRAGAQQVHKMDDT
jgi:hypothetical protein